MVHALLYLVFFIVIIFIWRSMRNKALNNKIWVALLREYKTQETPKTLSGAYLDIVQCSLARSI